MCGRFGGTIWCILCRCCLGEVARGLAAVDEDGGLVGGGDGEFGGDGEG